jgi:hypothetical protein
MFIVILITSFSFLQYIGRIIFKEGTCDKLKLVSPNGIPRNIFMLENGYEGKNAILSTVAKIFNE